MPETSLYRRHRPQSFDEVVGQEHVVRTLRNAVESDRVHHAYLFVGSRGTGKTSLAKILARSLNCVEGPTATPCGECESCRAIAAGTSLDVNEMDAASNRSVDDIRDLRERVGYAPAAGRWKVYILDEAHMLTREAWNAFLKTLEEPPPSTVFVLATTEPHKVMATIVDRCQRFDFQRPAVEQIAEVVRRVAAAEAIEIDAAAVAAIARAANGSFRDALGTLDQLVAYGGKSVDTEDVLAVLGVADAELILAGADAIAAGDGRAVLEVSERVASSGHDSTQFARDLLAHLRQLLVIRTVGQPASAFTVAAAEGERLGAQAEAFTDLGLTRAIDAIAAAIAAVREGDEPRMTIELALLRAARPELDPTSEALAHRLERIERALAGTGPAASPAGPAASRPAPGPERAGEGSEPAPTRPPQAADAPDPSSAEGARAGALDPVGAGPEAAGGSPANGDPSAEGEDPEPRGPAATAVGAVDAERLRELWPGVVDQVRRSGGEVLSHVLETARPLAVDAELAVLEIGFPASEAFNKRKAEAADARDRVIEALRTIVGERLRPVYVLLDGEQGEEGTGGERRLSEEEVLALLRDEFGAEEVSDDEAKEAEG
ncbi:MAG TPA: DNA polymerase III subunit gamma/tau [Solirubrobacterales bacterium]|nr:DNA polymerase III subunit gamma/tau [Solirubrobacterales bacterium]